MTTPSLLHRTLLASFLVASSLFKVSAQMSLGVGVSGSYNFQTSGFGAGARAELFVIKSVSVLMQGMYYPSLNQVHEVFGGADVHYAPYYYPIVRPYILAGGSVNYWFNYAVSHWDKAKPLNFIGEVGGGLVFLDKQWRPFIEYRYDPFRLEGSIHIGLMYFPDVFEHNRYTCPAYL